MATAYVIALCRGDLANFLRNQTAATPTMEDFNWWKQEVKHLREDVTRIIETLARMERTLAERDKPTAASSNPRRSQGDEA